MTVVSLTCGLCGTTDTVPVGAVLASVNVEGIDDHHAGCVGWMCSCCAQMVTSMVAWHPFLILLTAGVPLLDDVPNEDWAPAESNAEFDGSHGSPPAPHLPPHPEQPCGGERFTPDDLLTLHELLATDDWFAQLIPHTAV
jgi:hypothetical protein